MILAQRIAYHEASLILCQSLVDSRRIALGLYEVTYYTGKVNGQYFALTTQVGACGHWMAQTLAFRKIRRGWMRQALQRGESA